MDYRHTRKFSSRADVFGAVGGFVPAGKRNQRGEVAVFATGGLGHVRRRYGFALCRV